MTAVVRRLAKLVVQYGDLQNSPLRVTASYTRAPEGEKPILPDTYLITSKNHAAPLSRNISKEKVFFSSVVCDIKQVDGCCANLVFLVCFYSKLTWRAERPSLSHPILFCAHFLLKISADASGGGKSRATAIFPANFLARFFLGDPFLSFCLSRSTGRTQHTHTHTSTSLVLPSSRQTPAARAAQTAASRRVRAD